MGHLIMGERGRAAASLWLEHAPSIGLAIGPRQLFLSFVFPSLFSASVL